MIWLEVLFLLLLAGLSFFLASDEASFVTGHALCVDGGMTSGHRVGVVDALLSAAGAGEG